MFPFTPDKLLSPALLTRARNLAAEHANLSNQLATSFDPKIARRVGELGPVAKALAEWSNANEVCFLPP
jgi:peptide chain release factor 1